MIHPLEPRRLFSGMIGEYVGTIHAQLPGLLPITFDVGFDLKVTSQTAHSITGSVKVGHHTFSGSLIGLEGEHGGIRFHVKGSDVDIHLDGKLHLGRRITGNGDVRIGLFEVAGSFSAKRIH